MKHRGNLLKGSIRLLAVAGVAAATVAANAAWPKYFDTALHGQDYGNAIAIDKDGDVIVAGSSTGNTGEDFITIKYDRLGAELWKKRFNGPAGGQDIARAVATDAEGNIYVTGSSMATSSRADVFTIKYDPSGATIWQRRFTSPGLGSGNPQAIAIKGDVIAITGTSNSPETGLDMQTISYDADGNLLWARSLGGDGANSDEGASLCFGEDGSVYVGGTVYYNDKKSDMVLVKYSAAGRKVWVKRYDSSADTDYAVAAKVDPAGDIVLGGTSFNKRGDTDFSIVKFDADGHRLWVAKQDTGDRDELMGLAIDSLGNIAVTGLTGPYYGNFDYCTSKYDSAGQKLWTKRYAGSSDTTQSTDIPNSIGIDSTDNIYVTGTSQGSTTTDRNITTIKYTPEGQQKTLTVFGDADGVNQFASASILDPVRNRVYTTGYVANNSYQPLDILTIRN
jgi:uncharacterized delta-60 repeat protein